MVAEEVVVTLSGGAPWGFRLQGGAEQRTPLLVAKVRKRSKACRAGLRETDELVAINEMPCDELSHAQAMNLIDSGRGTLQLRVKRAPSAFQSVVLMPRSPSPRIDKEYRAALRALSPPLSSEPHYGHQGELLSPTGGPERLRSPPDSEAYYGETDSDADIVAQERQRRMRRRSPNISPAKTPPTRAPAEEEEEEEASGMSGYESAADGTAEFHGSQSWAQAGPEVAEQEMGVHGNQNHFQYQSALPGVPRREVVYQPPLAEWSAQAENSSENSDQSPPDGQGAAEVDSGFQEPPTIPPPLVSPERAKEALMLASHRQLVPMVGPVDNPVDEELTVTYMDKAKQAKLHRSESTQDKQVKEARSKCRTIASLLTDAPNPHSKGVLMFKKRRQRAKKYTLTCFGSVDGESCPDTEEESESLFPGSESELDEDGFSTAPDPTWDSGYLDILDRRTSACVPTDETTETSPGLNATTGKGAQLFEQQRKRAEKHATVQGIPSSTSTMPQTQQDMALSPPPVMQATPPEAYMVNGGPVALSRASVTLTSPGQISASTLPSLPALSTLPVAPVEQMDPSVGSMHNRTARPFAPGCVSHRAATAPVVFRPSAAKKNPPPARAVSSTTIPAPYSSNGSEVKRAISTTSLYIPARPATICATPSMLSPSYSSSLTSAPFSPSPSNGAPFSPQYSTVSSAAFSPPHCSQQFSPPHSAVQYTPSPAIASQQFSPPPPNAVQYTPPPATASQPFSQPAPTTVQYTPSPAMASQQFSPPPPNAVPYPTASVAFSPPLVQTMPFSPPASVITSPYPAPPPHTGSVPFSPPPPVAPVQAQVPPTPNVQLPPPHKVSFNPYISVASSTPVEAPTPPAQSYPMSSSTDGLSSREQRIAVPAARTGILQDSRRRSAKKPMFSKPEEKKVNSPNPALMSMVQNLDERTRSGPGAGLEGGFESGPEEDLLNLGAEACNFMQSQRARIPPPPVAPKPASVAPEFPQMGGKGAELFARRQSRMDRYVVDHQSPKSPAPPRAPSPTPSGQWKYSPNIRAPPPISYNPLLSPSCPPVAQRATKASEATKMGSKRGAGSNKQGIKALDYMSRQPYQLNSSLFAYGGGVPQTISANQMNGTNMTGGYLNPPKQVPLKAARVYEIKRFSTPTPMSAPTALTPTVIVPRSATTLGEPLWRSDVTSPPLAPVTQRPFAPFSPPPPAPTAALPALPQISSASMSNAGPLQNPVPTPTQAYTPFQAAKQFKSAPELSPLHPGGMPSAAAAGIQALRVPRPRFSTSSMGLQPKVWRPGSMFC